LSTPGPIYNAEQKTIPTIKELVNTPDPCPLCELPNYRPTDHHLVPRSRGGKVTATLCADCHRAIHVVFTNKGAGARALKVSRCV
jgi:hypothetical protein